MSTAAFGLVALASARRLLGGTADDGATSWVSALSDEDLSLELSRLCRIARLRYRCIADPGHGEEVARDPAAAARRLGLDVDPDEIRPLWHLPTMTAGTAEPVSPLVARYRDFNDRRSRRHEMFASAANVRDPRMRAWRERQVARAGTQLPPAARQGMLHAPVSFELCAGCSVGCWFCGVSAERLRERWPYDEKNAALWREVLEVTHALLGDGCRAGFCYYATDPFDNLDYERYLADYHQAVGVFPQTTTALALQDPARTRGLLRLAGEHGCGLNRFSVLSLSQLDRIEAEFSPEELCFVDLVLQNRESAARKFEVGRARKKRREPEPMAEGTSACVSGFLINLPERRVRLITPCPPSERWPLGQIELAEGRFTDGNDLRRLLERLVDRHMPPAPPEGMPLRFRRDLAYRGVEDGFHLTARYQKLRFVRDRSVAQLGELLASGRQTAEQIVATLSMCGVPSEATRRSIDALHRGGVLDDNIIDGTDRTVGTDDEAPRAKRSLPLLESPRI